MPIFASLVRSNLINLIGLIVYGFMLIGLTAIGYKIIASLVDFKPAGASEKQYLFMGISVFGLILGLSLIIAVSSYSPVPEVVLASGANIVGAGGGGGGCGSKSGGGCGGAARSPVLQGKSAPTPSETTPK